jgi:hypothetical protein
MQASSFSSSRWRVEVRVDWLGVVCKLTLPQNQTTAGGRATRRVAVTVARPIKAGIEIAPAILRRVSDGMTNP